MQNENDLFFVMKNMRPMRRLKSDPVKKEVIEEILDAAICAPNALNTQPYKFIVLENPEEKAWFGKAYDGAMKLRFTPILPDESDTSKNARNLRTAMEFGKTMKDVPILLIVCGKRDWPFSVDAKDRIGLAPPSPGSVYPCVQNILLACRAKGLGASLTTMHQMFESELCQRLDIPEEYGIVAVIPIGYPKGNFGPVSRLPSSMLTFFDKWGQTKQPD